MSRSTRGGLIGRLADEFDLSWRDRPPADIEAFYRTSVGGSGRPLDPVGRLALLVELVRIDLEYRWRPADKVRARWMVADYVRRFAELQAGGWDAVSLMADEFRVRWQWGDKPERAKFVADHAHLEPHLTPALAGVERSLGVKSTPRPSVTPSDQPTELPLPDATRYRPPSTPVVPPPPASLGKAAPTLPATFAGYEIRRELGRGGMGVVYEAWDPSLKRSVALKVILSGDHAGVEEVARFRKEAQAVAKLKHPNVVQILQFGEYEGRPFFALEYVAGGTLARALRAGPQPAGRAAAVVLALAEGMAVAHAAGIVHRDLKPGNVLLDGPQADTAASAPPVPKITDFGLVKDLEDDGERTHAGRVMGTPSYMAPEQAEGRIDDLGPPADVYALGVILYEMLVGRPPFRGASAAETIDLVRKKDPLPPRQLQPSVPFDLETICLKCLRKDPHQRYESAEELADDLKRYQAGRPILARPVGVAEQAWKFYRRNPVVVWTAAGVFALLLVVMGTAVYGAVAAVGEATALRDKTQAERDKGTAEVKKVEAEGKQAVAEQKLTLKESDLLIGVCERELHSNGDSALAERNLNLFPEQYRGWEWHYLKRRLDGERKPLSGHTGGLWSVAVHPDGTEVATASIDGTVRRWDVATGTSTAFDGHRSKTEAVVKVVKQTGAADAISGLRIIGQGVDTAMSQVGGGVRPPVSVGDLPDPNKVPKHLTPVLRVAYSRDGKYVASGALDPNVKSVDVLKLAGGGGGNPASANFVGRVLVWDRDGHVAADFAEHKTLVTALAFHPDGRHVASAGMEEGNAWKLWTWEGGKTRTVKSFPGHKGLLGQIRFNGDGNLAATGSTDGTAIVWDVAAGTPKWVFADHHATVHDLAFSADGHRLATAGMDGTVRVWDLTKPDPTKDPVVLRGHIGSALGVAFSPDGMRVASGGFDRTVRVWDPATGTEKITLRGHTEAVWSVAFDKSARLVSASFDGTARVWDPTATTDDGTVLARNLVSARSQEEAEEDHRVNRLAYSRDGRRLATAGWDRTATLIDTADPTGTTTFKHDGPVWGVAFSPTADRLVTGSWDTTVRVWDVATKRERPGVNGGPFAKLNLPVQSVAYSHKGKRIAAATWDGTVTVWDADSGEVKHTFHDHLLPVYDLAFSPDDTHLASAGGDRKAVVRSLTGGGKAEMTDHTATVYRVAFDHTGKRLAVASWDQTVSLWRFDPARTSATRVLADVPVRHDDYITGVVFSPDGRRLATVGHDKTLREWNATTGQPVGEPRTQRGVVWDVAYAPTGDKLAVAVWNPNGWVWEKPAVR